MNKSIKKIAVEFVFRMFILNILLDIKHPFKEVVWTGNQQLLLKKATE